MPKVAGPSGLGRIPSKRTWASIHDNPFCKGSLKVAPVFLKCPHPPLIRAVGPSGLNLEKCRYYRAITRSPLHILRTLPQLRALESFGNLKVSYRGPSSASGCRYASGCRGCGPSSRRLGFKAWVYELSKLNQEYLYIYMYTYVFVYTYIYIYMYATPPCTYPYCWAPSSFYMYFRSEGLKMPKPG